MINKTKIIFFTLVLTILMGLLMPFAHSAENTSNGDKEFKLKKEIISFIPYTQLSKLLEKKQKLIYIPYQELKKLLAEKSVLKPLSPVNFVIKDLTINGIVHDNFASFDATYKIEILNKEWVFIPLLSTQTGLKSAILDSKPAPVSISGNNFRILSDQTGDHNLQLKFDVKINTSGNTKNLNFNIPNIPIIKLNLEVPEEFTTLNIPYATGQKTEYKSGKTITHANIAGAGNISVSWKSNLIKPIDVKPVKVQIKEDTRPSKVITELKTLISADEGIIQGVSTYQCQIYHKPIEKLTIKIPDDVEIIDISSPNNIVKKGVPIITDPDKTKPGKILNVFFNSKIKDNATFSVTFEKTFENKNITVEIPNLILAGKEITKTIGYVAIQSYGSIEVKQSKVNEITPIDIKDLPYDLERKADHPILLAYSFIKNNYTLDLEIIPHKDAPVQVAMIDTAYVDSRLSSNGIITTKADYKIRNMSEQYFKFSLPQGAEILTGLINGQIQQIEKENKSKTNDVIYLINIKKHQTETLFTLSVMYKQDYKFNILNHLLSIYTIETPKVMNIPILTIKWSAYLPENMKYKYFSDLNESSRDYSSLISSSKSDSGWSRSEGMSGYKDEDLEYDKRQVSNVAGNFEVGDDTKASGILPPSFTLPPTTGLIKNDFSDYLLKTSSSEIFVISVTKLLDLIVFLVMLYLGWTISKRFAGCFNPSLNSKDRAKIVVPTIILLYIVGLIIGSFQIWFPVILSGIVYTLIKLYEKYFKEQCCKE